MLDSLPQSTDPRLLAHSPATNATDRRIDFLSVTHTQTAAPCQKARTSFTCSAVPTDRDPGPLRGSEVFQPPSAPQPADLRTVLCSLNRPPSPRNSDQASSLSLAGTLVPLPAPTLGLAPHVLHQASPQASALLRQRHLVGPQDQTHSPGPNLQSFGVMPAQVEDASQ